MNFLENLAWAVGNLLQQCMVKNLLKTQCDSEEQFFSWEIGVRLQYISFLYIVYNISHGNSEYYSYFF